jgi:formamidopyrimidine-DNA glycosylase
VEKKINRLPKREDIPWLKPTNCIRSVPMYELPDILVLAQQMNTELKGKTIKHAQFNEKGYYNLAKEDFEAALIEKTVQSVTGRGKWVYVKLDHGMYLQFGEHTGHVLYHTQKESIPDIFTLRIEFTDSTVLTIRNYGMSFIRVINEEEIGTFKYPGTLGVSPLGEEFTFEQFNCILQENSKKMIKALLLDQSKIAGIGNGYFQEIVFRAKIHPKRKAGDMSEEERKALYTAIQNVLKEALQSGGKDDTYDLYNNQGGYKKILGAHALGTPCPVCGTPIEKLSISGSTTYVCTSCQK